MLALKGLQVTATSRKHSTSSLVASPEDASAKNAVVTGTDSVRGFPRAPRGSRTPKTQIAALKRLRETYRRKWAEKRQRLLVFKCQELGLPTHLSSLRLANFDPDTIFPGVVTLSNQLSAILQKQLTPPQESEFEDHVLHCLATMVYGSNMIERAGSGFRITLILCFAIFRGEEIPEDIEETEEVFLELKKKLLRNDMLANVSTVLQSRREIIQHAKAASYIISQLCVYDKDLSAEGVYRTEEVSAGLHAFPHHSLVPFKMKAMVPELESDLEEAIDKRTVDPVAIASKYTHIFVNIHPFIDGNGRMCRLILNSMLLKLGSFLVCIGEKEEDRSLYMAVASNGGALEDMYGDLDEDEKPAMHKELGGFVLSHAKSMRKLVTMLS
ncbi:hypothetical protein N7519_005792 [Penicillium mononematosum]|uniref:uncharacterized protein n=1 Tax=Penicillium mononematosum TaxID=268346 RepID=UPI002547FEF6|nr:uncharacterized protein N7519_005792 [Penicillium mononematosum]KAJ6184491.1 hypothetical protein N7519_005792 [Penicillium mononematosum]